MKPSVPDTIVFQRARLAGIITGRGHSWGCERALLDRGLRRPKARTMPVTAEIAYGLGELLAYTHMGFSPALDALRQISAKDAETLLDEATKLANAEHRTSGFEEITAGQMLGTTALGGEVMDYAYAYLMHQPRPQRRLFGLSVFVETIARFHPKVFARWLARPHSSNIHHTVLNYLADRLIFAESNDPLHAHLLRSNNPVLQALVTQSFVTRYFEEEPASFRELFDRCRAAGVTASDAFILALPGAAHQTGKLKYVRQQARKAQEKLAFNNLLWPGTGSNSTPDYQMRADEAEDVLAAVETRVTADIQDMADCWPSDELSPEGIKFFMLTAGQSRSEVRFRVAEKLAPSPSRTDLLDNIAQDLGQVLGVDNPADSVRQTLYEQPDDFLETAHWSGAALRLRSEGENKGVGQRTSQFIGPLVMAARKLTDGPFAAVRRPHYGAALSKRIGAVLFALNQAYQGGSVQPDLHQLAALALDDAREILACDVNKIGDARLFDQVALASVHIMASSDTLDRRADWAMDDRLSDFARAMAIWTSPTLVAANPELAHDLFLASGSAHFRRFDGRVQNRACLLLDAALAARTITPSTNGNADICSLWDQVAGTWPEDACSNASKVYDAVIDALSGGAAGKGFILTDPNWRQTQCGQWVASRYQSNSSEASWKTTI